MTRLRLRVMSMGLACLGMFIPPTLQAAPIPSQNVNSSIAVVGSIELAQAPPPGYRRYDRRRHWDDRRHYRRGPPPGWRRGGPAIIIAPPPPPRYRASRSHVRWCSDRYRSYNARTDTYRGFDGRNHRCNSPFR